MLPLSKPTTGRGNVNRRGTIVTGAIAATCVGAVIVAYLLSTAGSAENGSSTAQAAGRISTQAVLKATKWASVVKATYGVSSVKVTTNDIPNHKRDAYYAVPDGQVVVPDASTARIVKDPTKAQSLSFTIPTKPEYTSTITDTPLGSIGLMISGSVLYNPYEGDGTTVAMSSNFSLTRSNGTKVWFVDHCSGHPTPDAGQYHYHAGSSCVERQVDRKSGPSHLIGVALDGFPIYGPRDINGKTVPVKSLDRCNGIKSATPEFPQGIYHYVLPDTTDATSSIRCFHGVVDATQIMAMPPMGGGGGGGGTMPDLAAAAATLGITEMQLMDALGKKMPPDFAAAAAKLGVTEAKLKAALGVSG